MTYLSLAKVFGFVEFFAGEAAATKNASWGGYMCASMDIKYWGRFRKWLRRLRGKRGKELTPSKKQSNCHANPFDIMTYQGLAFFP